MLRSCASHHATARHYPPPATYTVTIASGIENGTVTASPTTAAAGAKISLTATPASGYKLDAWDVKAGTKKVTVTDNAFTMPDSNVTVSATFTAKTPTPATYTVTIASGIENGTVTASPTTAAAGTEITLTAEAASGFTFGSYSVTDTDGNSVKVENGKFKMPASNVNVSATFTATYTVTIASGIENGTVTASPTTAAAGAKISLTATPASGYKLDAWDVKAGTKKVTVTDNAFTMPDSNVTVSATFTAKTASYTVKHLQQNIADDNYTLKESETKTGKVTEAIDISAKSYEGFTVQAVTVAESGTEVVIKYNRKMVTVTFDSDDGTTVSPQPMRYEAKATKPADPTKSEERTSYIFLGWYNGDTAFDFATAITADITLKAKWLKGFAKVTGATINGDENWTPESKVFISNRKLTIGNLYVCDHEVTRGEYKELIGSDPSVAKAYDKDGNELTGDAVLNNPVNNVSWYAAIAYCNKLSIKEGLTPCYKISDSTDPAAWGNPNPSQDFVWDTAICDFKADGYRLPTEAEWEWLARGGENYTYAGSDTIDAVAWNAANANKTGSEGSRDVKTKNANGYRLYDMSGNVWEWCWDWHEKEGESSISESTGETGLASGIERVARGGSWGLNNWNTGASDCKVSSREQFFPGDSDSMYGRYGFRLVRSCSD